MSIVRTLACWACRRRVAAVTVEQAAELKSVHRRTLYRWIEQGKVHLIRLPDMQLYVCRESLLDKHRSFGDRQDFATLGSRVEQIVELIGEQYPDASLTLGKLCRQLKLSYWHISRLFNQQTGTNFRLFLMDVRLRKAAELMSATNLSLKEIAAEVGYKHVSDFCHHFKRVYGVTPSEHRRDSNKMAPKVAGDGLESRERERERERKKALPIRSEHRTHGRGLGLMS